MEYFTSIPYKYAWYDDHVSNDLLDTEEQIELRRIMEKIKLGSLSEIESLTPLLCSTSKDIRQYSFQLLADTCRHQDLYLFEKALTVIEEISEYNNLLLRLGASLSLEAIPIILEIANDIDVPDVYEYAMQAIETILPIADIDEFILAEENVAPIFEAKIASLDRTLYYYNGQPIFIGDVCKEFINVATVSLQQRKGAVFVIQPQILANFSGIKCPVKYGCTIDNETMSDVFQYVKKISSSPVDWKRGGKYFFTHQVI